MNKKILLSSNIAIVVLIGVSFTSVVGYNSVESNVKESPLFNIRTSRAIDEESEEVGINYLGKGNRIDIHLPVKDNKVELLDRFGNIIRQMDDNSFYRFVDLMLKCLNTNEFNKEDIIITFNQIRNNPSNYIEKRDTELATESGPTACIGPCLTTDYGIKGYLNCLLFLMLVPLFVLIFIGGNIIYF